MVGNSRSLVRANEALEGRAEREENEKHVFSHHSTTNFLMFFFSFRMTEGSLFTNKPFQRN